MWNCCRRIRPNEELSCVYGGGTREALVMGRERFSAIPRGSLRREKKQKEEVLVTNFLSCNFPFTHPFLLFWQILLQPSYLP